MSENLHGLSISLEELTRIREACQRRRAELEAAGALPGLSIAPGSSQSAVATLPTSPPIPAQESEAERFALVVQTMPPRVRAFFEREESPYVSPRQLEKIRKGSPAATQFRW
jgi:hypothetical protein